MALKTYPRGTDQKHGEYTGTDNGHGTVTRNIEQTHELTMDMEKSQPSRTWTGTGEEHMDGTRNNERLREDTGEDNPIRLTH